MKKNCTGFIILITAFAILYAQSSPTPSKGNELEKKDSVVTSESGEESSPVDTLKKSPDKTEKKIVSQESAADRDSIASKDSTLNKEAVVADKEIVVDKDSVVKVDTVATDKDSAVVMDTDTTTVVTDSTGVLNIATVPDSVFVIFDGNLKGRSPVIIKDIPAGKHTIILKKKGHFVKKATVNVTAGSENELRFELIKPVKLSVSSEPVGATVMINDKKVGTTPYTDRKLKPAQYDIMLVMEGYKQEQHTVTLGSGERDSIYITLVPLPKLPEDTVSVVKKKDSGKKKSKLSSILDKVALGVFVGFSLIILLVELTQDK